MRKVRLGQHFLHDPNIVRKIIQLGSLTPSDTVLEIGTGRGILTKALAQVAGKVISIELDHDLHRELRATLRNLSNVTLVCADALQYPFSNLSQPFKVVANLPYSVATPILFRLLEIRDRITEMVLMLQLEVARRIVASTGQKNYSPLSIAVQFYTQPSLAFIVSRHCFHPPPDVNSAVVRLKNRKSPSVQVLDESFFFKVVKGSFAHRRKMLKNSLRDSGFPMEVLEQVPTKPLSLDLNRRAETLSLKEFAQLSDHLFELTSQNMVPYLPALKE